MEDDVVHLLGDVAGVLVEEHAGEGKADVAELRAGYYLHHFAEGGGAGLVHEAVLGWVGGGGGSTIRTRKKEKEGRRHQIPVACVYITVGREDSLRYDTRFGIDSPKVAEGLVR